MMPMLMMIRQGQGQGRRRGQRHYQNQNLLAKNLKNVVMNKKKTNPILTVGFNGKLLLLIIIDCY
jgi:hypothetical protein